MLKRKYFFLTNDERVSDLVCSLIKKGNIVINGDFLSKKRSKSIVQCCVVAAGVRTPKLQTIPSLTPPFYLKSECHTQGVLRFETVRDIDFLLANGSLPDGWYLEEAVDGPESTPLKFYWVNGYCYGCDNKAEPNENIKKAMRVIAETFRFDVFSADFFVSRSAY